MLGVQLFPSQKQVNYCSSTYDMQFNMTALLMTHRMAYIHLLAPLYGQPPPAPSPEALKAGAYHYPRTAA